MLTTFQARLGLALNQVHGLLGLGARDASAAFSIRRAAHSWADRLCVCRIESPAISLIGSG
jgi:hypothetical protein